MLFQNSLFSLCRSLWISPFACKLSVVSNTNARKDNILVCFKQHILMVVPSQLNLDTQSWLTE